VRIWLGVGLATAGGQNGIEGFGLLGQVVYQGRPHQAMLRALALLDVENFPDGSDDGTAELGLLYGRTRTRRWGHVSGAAGASVVNFERCPDRALGACSTVGLPLTAEAAVNSPILGVGLQAFGNLNPKASYGGLGLFLQLGWLP
jgi:hypothetical protein